MIFWGNLLMRIVALCAGQGSQQPGMGKSLFDEYGAARAVYECAGDILGFDLAKISFEGSAEEITQTAICQPALFAVSLAAWEAARDQLPAPEAVAGHSVGEYAALYCAGAFSMEDGFKLIGARAKVMETAARAVPGTMVAVAGMEPDAIKEVCAKHGDAWAVNFNLPSQTVISGKVDACLAAAEEMNSLGAKTTRLNVDSAFHTPLMQPAADRFRDLIKGISYNGLRCDFYSNTTGGLLEVSDYTDYFVNHMLGPVRFAEEMAALAAAGIDTCIEFGAGKTASTLAKKNNRAFATFNIECAKTLEKAAGSLTAAV